MFNINKSTFLIFLLFFSETNQEKSSYFAKSHLNHKSFKDNAFNWKIGQVLSNSCATNSARFLNLMNLVCSTAQPLNTTIRDGCYGCFSRYATLPQGIQQLSALSLCATTYFAGNSYAQCATRLNALVNNNQVVTPVEGSCAAAYCEFVRCLRRINSQNLIIQCGREVRAATPINIALDADNVRFFTNITSCILAKTRCSLYNPVTGDTQLPGVTAIANGNIPSQVPISNSLQISTDGSLRVIAMPTSVTVTSTYCSAQNILTQSNWINNECP